MKIEHLAIWTIHLEAMKAFYEKYFQATAGSLYHNPDKKFKSYFLSFHQGCRLELMMKESISTRMEETQLGLAHFALSVGTKDAVNRITEQLRADGIIIFAEPRTTGDGYYESVILDPDGNQIEITI